MDSGCAGHFLEHNNLKYAQTDSSFSGLMNDRAEFEIQIKIK